MKPLPLWNVQIHGTGRYRGPGTFQRKQTQDEQRDNDLGAASSQCLGEGGRKLPRGGGHPGQRTPTGNAASQGPQAGRKPGLASGLHCLEVSLLPKTVGPR